MCDPIDDHTNTVNGIEKSCPNDRCGELIESEIEDPYPDIDDDKAAKKSCSQSYINRFIASKLERCDYYGSSNVDCVVYINDELTRACGGAYNCIVTNRGDWASYKTFSGMTNSVSLTRMFYKQSKFLLI